MIREAVSSDVEKIRNVFARIGARYTLEELKWHMDPCQVYVMVSEDSTDATVEGDGEGNTEEERQKNAPIRGGVFVCKQGPFWAIHGLIVDPPFQRRGIATTLMQHVLGLAKEADVLVRLTSSVVGLHLYHKLGFRRTATSTMLVRTLKDPASNDDSEVSHVDDASLTFDEVVTADDMSAINSLSTSGTRRCRRDLVNEAHIFRLLGKSCSAMLVRDARQKIIGFGVVRQTARFVILGPVVAPSVAIAKAILAQLLSRALVVDDRFDDKARVANDGGSDGKSSAGLDSDSHDAEATLEEMKIRIDVTSDVDVDGELRKWLVNRHHFHLQEEFPLMEWCARGPSPVDASRPSLDEPSQWALISPALL